jgi:hypothetical protein
MVDFTENELNAIEESISIIQGFMRMYKTNPDINHINEISQMEKYYIEYAFNL